LTALEKLPADRFGSAAEFSAALNGDEAKGRVTESPSRRAVGRSSAEPPSRAVRRACPHLVGRGVLRLARRAPPRRPGHPAHARPAGTPGQSPQLLRERYRGGSRRL